MSTFGWWFGQFLISQIDEVISPTSQHSEWGFNVNGGLIFVVLWLCPHQLEQDDEDDGMKSWWPLVGFHMGCLTNDMMIH